MPSGHVDEIRNEYLLRMALSLENIQSLLINQNQILASQVVTLQAIQVSLTNFGESINVFNDTEFFFSEGSVNNSEGEY